MKYTTLPRLSAIISFSLIICLPPAFAEIRPPATGDLVISEIMTNPAAVSDTQGEWFEVFNKSPDFLIIDGLEISDNGSNLHIVNTDNGLLINPAEYFVFARSDDPTANGGFNADYAYNNVSLSNSNDAIILSFNDLEITRLEYETGFGIAGNSMELIGFPADPTNYQLTPAELSFGLGDIGTPGAMGSTELAVSEVPLPPAFWLFASGLLGMLGIQRRK